MKRLLLLLRPRLVVTVGHTALGSLQQIYPDWRELRQFILNYDVGNVLEQNKMAVYPLYHTSKDTLKTRPELRQSMDWKRIPQILEALEEKPVVLERAHGIGDGSESPGIGALFGLTVMADAAGMREEMV